MKIPRLRSPLLSLGFLVPLMAARCGGGSSYLAGGEVVGDSLATYRAVDYQLTSDNYTRWLKARGALDSVNVEPTVRLNTRRLTDADIDRVIQDLESQPRARAAIESRGLSVRDYVLTTIALAQSWDAANRPTVHVSGLPPRNVEFLRRQAAEDGVVRERPRARFLDDDSDDDSERPGRRHRKRHGGDSDSDS